MRTRIHWGDGYVRVTPKVPNELKEKLRYWHKQMDVDPVSYKRVMTGTYRDCFTYGVGIDEHNQVEEYLVTFPGYMHLVKQTLDELGWEYQVLDERIPFPEPNFEAAFAGLRDYQLEAAYTLIMSGGGICNCPTGWGKTHIIASLLRAFSHEELCARNTPLTVLAAPDKDLCLQNYMRMREMFVTRDVGILMSGKNEVSDDIQIVTLDSLHRLNMDDVGMLVIDEVHQAASSKRAELLSQFGRARKWGASATPTGRFDGSDKLTEGLVGPVVYQRTYQQGVLDGALVPIIVYWVECPEPHIGIDKYLKYKSRKGKYDWGVEKNHSQRDIIVELLKRTPDKYQTLCIMQHTTQMNEIVEYVPGVEYVHGATDAKKLVTQRQYQLAAIPAKQRKAIYNKFRSGKIRKIMSTHIYKQGVDFPELEVMIQAGGGGAPIANGQIPGRGSRPSEGKDVAILIDFWHPWDTEMKLDEKTKKNKKVMGPVYKDDRARDRIYEKLGFQRHWITDINDLPILGGERPVLQGELQLEGTPNG